MSTTEKETKKTETTETTAATTPATETKATETAPVDKYAEAERANGDSEEQIEAEKLVRNYMLWTGAAGIIPMPLADMAAIAALQLAMLQKIAKIYDNSRKNDIKFTNQWGKQVIGSLTGGIASTSIGMGISNNFIKSIPMIGGLMSVIMVPGFAAASTWALGQVFIMHFESGGTLLTFDAGKVKKYYNELFTSKRKELSGATA